MPKFIKQISHKASLIIGLHLMYVVATVLTSSFAHILLWRLTSNFSFIAFFDLIFVFATLFGYIISAYLLTILKSDKILRAGFLSITISYIMILYWQQSFINHVFLISLLNGFGNGIYWGVYNLLKLRETTDNNREHFFGIISGVYTFIATIFPALAGFVIVFLPTVIGLEFAGYYILYALSICIFLIMTGYVEALPKFNINNFNFKKVLKLTNSKNFRNFSMYQLLAGIYETGSKMVLIVFSFIILGNEFNLGVLSGIFGLISAIYIYLAGRKIDIKKRSEIIFIGASLIFIGRIVFIKFLTLDALIIDRFLEALGGPLFGLPIAAAVLTTIENRSNFVPEKEQQYLVAGEIPLNFGRFFGSLFFLLFLSIFGHNDLDMIKVWFFVVSTTSIAQWYFVKKFSS